MNLLNQINRRVNEATQYRADTDLYGKPDFWEVAQGSGDCEDYALAKRKLLLEAGFAPESLRLATCWTETGEYHAVLIVTSDDGDYVLDNRYPMPMMRQDLGYRWDKIQQGASWHVIA